MTNRYRREDGEMIGMIGMMMPNLTGSIRGVINIRKKRSLDFSTG